MKTWKLPRLISATIVFLVALTVILGAFALYHLVNIESDTDELVGDQVPSLVTVTRIRALTKDNVINALLYIATDDDAMRADLKAKSEKNSAEINASYDYFQKNCVTDETDQALFDKVASSRVPFSENRKKVFALADSGDRAKATEHVLTQLLPVYNLYNAAIEESANLQLKTAEDAGQGVLVNIGYSRRDITVTGVITVIVGVGAGLFVTRLVRRRIGSITLQLSDGAAQVHSAAEQVSGASQSLAEGSSEQAASLEETSASLEEISSMTQRNAENASQAKNGAAKARAAAETGAKDMEAMAAAMDEIKVSSDNISKIIKTIDEIAFQTNILALNAAVEAARAGDAGAGFAVVADEVRALAQRSAQAAKETADKIEDSIRKSGQGVALSTKVAASLQEILEHSRKVDSLVAEIAQASAEQSSGLNQVVGAVSQMDKVTQANAAGAEESASAAQQLTAQSGTLHGLVRELEIFVGAKAAARAAQTAEASPAPHHAPAVRHHDAGKPVAKTHAAKATKRTAPAVAVAGAAGGKGGFFDDTPAHA